MKKLFTLAFVLLWCAVAGITVFALEEAGGDTPVKAVVPDYITITLRLDGDTRVLVGGQEYGDGDLLMVPFNTPVTLTFIPGGGKTLAAVVLDGEDITGLLENNAYTANGFKSGVLLSVSVKDAAKQPESSSSTPSTGNNSHMTLWLLLGSGALILLAAMSAAGRKRRKYLMVKK